MLALPLGFVFLIALLLNLPITTLLSHSAYAITPYMSLSRGTSGDIILKDGTNTSIRPTKDGTLGIGSDIVNVDTNCSAGYNIYLTAAENEGVDLILSSADTTSDIPISQKIVSSSTPIGSETTLEKNTWGVGKTASAFAGIQAYNTNTSTLTPFYHDTVTGGKDFTFYYGANITDEKIAGIYTIDVLYTAVTNTTCAEYTLSFDISSATTVSTPSVYATRTISVDEKINLATLSSTSNISKTGYHITGWRNKKNTTETYGITGEVDVNPSDVINPTTSSDPTASAIILEPIWTANTYTIAYAAGSTGATCSITSTSATYDQNVTLSNTKCTKTGYTQDGWSTSSAADNTKTYNMGATLTKPNFTSTNNGTYTLYPHFTANTYTIKYNSNAPSGTTASGSTADTTGATYGSTVSLRANGFSVASYTFQGWAHSSSATSATYTGGQTGVSVTTLATTAGVQNTNGGTINLYAVWKLNAHTVTISRGTGISSTTGAGTYVTGQTVTISATPTSGYRFSSWTVNSGGVTLSPNTTTSPATFTMPDNDVTITANGATIPNCSATVHPTATTGCKMSDGRTWILGNNGNSITWNSMFTGATGANNHNATVKSGICPTGYSAPKITDFDTLIRAYGGNAVSENRDGYALTTGALYSVLGRSGDRYYWSSTENSSYYAYYLFVASSYSDSVSSSNKTDSYYVLCYKY